MLKQSDFTKLEHGPYGTRWSLTYEEGDTPPSVEQAEKILGVKLAPQTCACSGEREDELCEEVYFAAEEFNENTLATYQVQ